MTVSDSWVQFNDMLTNKIIAWAVSAFAALAGIKGIALEYTNQATSVLGLISVVIAIVVGYLTIKNLRLKNKLLLRELDKGENEQLSKAVTKELHK